MHKIGAPDDLLLYNSDHKVIICNTCQYAIQPHSVDRHLKEIHALRRPLRKPYTDYAASVHLADPAQVLEATISDDGFPLPFLPVLNGLQCLSPACGHLCASAKRMQGHWTAVHQKHGCPALDWQPVPLQTFFRGNLLRYFTHPLLSGIASELVPGLRKPGYEQLALIQNAWEAQGLVESDQQLLQNYLTSTYVGLANRHGSKDLWQLSIPYMARSSPFLRHGILACSALQLSHSSGLSGSDVDRLSSAANTHWEVAQERFREASAPGCVTRTSCHPVLAFIHLQVIWAFATAHDSLLSAAESVETDGMALWLYNVRHGCHIICGYWDTAGNGPLGSLVHSWGIPIIAPDDRSTRISDLLLSIAEQSKPAYDWSGDTSGVYAQAASELALALSAAQALGPALTAWDAIRLWPLTVSIDYVALVNQQHPGAMALLACYCIILGKIQSSWYTEGLCSRVLDSVFNRLDKSWGSLVQRLRLDILSILEWLD